ncbi:MAG TPA: hypothetical protein VGK67_10795 [Myxococcales bacterium]
MMAAAGCSSSQKDNKGKILAYIVSQDSAACAKHLDGTTCGGASGCEWAAADIACMAGMTCPSGICIAKDACIDHQDASSCAADAKCAWSATKDLVAVGSDPGANGFCHAISVSGGSCACVSPVSCPNGAQCPPMECDCAGGGESGGSCTCACSPCEAGKECPPCACDCQASDPSQGCVSGGTCACACPACPDNAACAPCACDCLPSGDVVGSGTKSGGGSTGSSGTSNCTCPACVAGSACAPCTCDGGAAPVDPCNAHGDATACAADTTNACAWYGMGACACPACEPGKECPACDCGSSGMCVHVVQDPCAAHADATSCAADATCIWYGMGVPCAAGQECRSGVCQTLPPPTDPGACVCACPAVACDKDSNCLPCACTCGGGGSSGGTCTPPSSSGGGTTDPQPPPAP